MNIITLPTVILEIQSSNLMNQAPFVGDNVPTQKVLNVSGVFKTGDVVISYFNESFTLTDAELEGTVLGAIDSLTVLKIKEKFKM